MNRQDVLDYLTDLSARPEKRLLSGQYIGGDNGPADYQEYITALHDQTGKWVAMISIDYAWGPWGNYTLNDNLIDHWNDGGLVSISWHAYNPWTGGGQSDRNIGALSDLWTPGNDAYDTWRRDLDRKAEWLADLHDAGVVVLWRPFHEMNGDWSWWGMRNQSDFVQLWRSMHDYYEGEKGLDNLLWVFSPNRSWPDIAQTDFYYPGDDYVDIVGIDYYQAGNTFANIDDEGLPELLALGKPFAVTEFGPVVGSGVTPPPTGTYDYSDLIQEIKAHCPQACYFMPWFDDWSIINQAGATEMFDDEWVIARSDVHIIEDGDGNGNGNGDDDDGGDEMGIVEMLLARAAELRTIADALDAFSTAELRAIADELETAASTLATLDASAQAAVTEAQEALAAAQVVEEAL